jgi:type I restriction enzyme S subunit
MSVRNTVKSIQDIMRQDSGVDGDAQRISQLCWMFFLKIIDDQDQELEALREGYPSPIPKPLRWRSWAADPEGITGEELLTFVNSQLFPKLKTLSLTGGQANVSQHVAVIRVAVQGIQRYLHKLILSPYFQSFVLSEQTGAGRGGLPKNRMDRIPVALPPLAEQHRIIAKVDGLMALCDRLEATQEERETRRDRLTAASHHYLNNGADADALQEHTHFFIQHLPQLTVRPDQLKQLRQTILSLAVRGNLVRQDPADQPASGLLKRILDEKARLMKEGKIRKQKLQAEIEPKETPFVLPQGWVWVCLGDVIHLVSGQHLQPNEYSTRNDSGPPYITGPADFGDHGLVITRYALVRKAVAKKGQILLTVKGAGVGKTAICDPQEVAISRQLMAMTAIAWNQQFLVLVTHRLAETLRTSARSLIPGISREDVDKFVFALPPLAEQHRIVARVAELMAICDRLEAQLTTAQTESSRLLEAILCQAIDNSLESASRSKQPISA